MLNDQVGSQIKAKHGINSVNNFVYAVPIKHFVMSCLLYLDRGKKDGQCSQAKQRICNYSDKLE